MRPTALISLVLLSCGPGEDSGDDILGCQGSPHILIDPLGLDFGTVAVGDPEEHVLVATIGNSGDCDLHLQNLEVQDTSAPFSITGVQSVLVPPSGNTQFEVVFGPCDDGVIDTHVLISSDDPTTPVASLFVGGEAVSPVLLVEPTSADLGAVPVGCAASAIVTAGNSGSSELTLESASLNTTSGAFTLSTLPDLPVTLTPAEGVTLEVTWAPMAEGDDEAVLTLGSDDPWSPSVQVALSGVGLTGAGDDSFVQAGVAPTDVLVAVDWTTVAALPEVQDRLEAFVAEAFELGDDVHIGIFTADDGCTVHGPGWLDRDTEDVPGAIAALLAEGVGDTNAHNAFMQLEAALAETTRGGCNEGLRREDGRLMLVAISDQEEQSCNPWTYYVSLFQGYDPDVMISGVGGPYPDGCADADPYTGVWEASLETGGLFLSLCDPSWGMDLAPLALTRGSPRGAFRLSQVPLLETVVVTVNGALHDHWTWDTHANSVVLEPSALPDGGDEVRIHYTRADACEE